MKNALLSVISFCAIGITALAQNTSPASASKTATNPREAWISVCALGQRHAPTYDKNYQEIPPDPTLLHPTNIWYQVPPPAPAAPGLSAPKPTHDDLYKSIPLRLNIAGQWNKIPLLSGNTLTLCQTGSVPNATGQPTTSYRPYINLNVPPTSQGSVLFLARSWDPRRPAESSWDRPLLLNVPLETFMDQNGQFRENLVLVTNTLPYPVAYRIGAQGGQIAPGKFACVPLSNVQNSSASYKVQVNVAGKWRDFEGSEGTLYINSQSAAALVLYANFTRKKKDPLQATNVSIRFPELSSPQTPTPDNGR